MKIKINITEGHGCGGCGACDSCSAGYENEARMHRTTLAHLMADVKALLSMIEDGDDLPEWLETKITKAGDYMSSAARYIAGEVAREQGQLAEEEELPPEMLEEPPQKPETPAKTSTGVTGVKKVKISPKGASVTVKGRFEEQISKKNFSEGLIYHLENNIPVSENVFRPGSDEYFKLFKEVRTLNEKGMYELTEEEEFFINETPDLGEWGWCEEEQQMVPLDFPLYENASQKLLDEKRKAKKKKDPPIGKPMKNTGGGKKYKVYVRSKSGRVKKITYGDSKGGLKGNWNNPEARKSFAARHDCAGKAKKPNKRETAGYWACRAHKDFGTNVSGRFW